MFILDMRFLVSIFERIKCKEPVKVLNGMIEKAVIEYCTINAADIMTLLQSDEWFNAIVDRILQSIGAATGDFL